MVRGGGNCCGITDASTERIGALMTQFTLELAKEASAVNPGIFILVSRFICVDSALLHRTLHDIRHDAESLVPAFRVGCTRVEIQDYLG